MKIINLQAENFKRLKAIDITPDENLVILSGRNAQGKTSVLDAIAQALGGKDGTTSLPIREGESKASAIVDLGDFRVERTWKGDRTELKVVSQDGAKYPSPQKFLDEKLGKYTLDPLAFSRQNAKEQRAALLSILDLPFDLDDLKAQRQELYDARRDVSRDYKNLQIRLESCPEAVDGELINLDLLQSRLDEAITALAEEQHRIEKLDAIEAQIETTLKLLESLQEERDSLSIPGIISSDDVDTLKANLHEAREFNLKLELGKGRHELEAEIRAKAVEIEDIQKQMDDLDAQVSEAMENAAMPIDNLEIEEEGILYHGIPFAQLSGAEQFKISCAIAMALNPEIRVLRITDGSLLDSTNLEILRSLATAHDYQIWIERVDESGEVGFVIEDGEVKG